VEKKGQLVIEIVTRSGKTYLRKPEGVREWFEHILENKEDTRQERIMQRSLSLIENNHYQDTVTSFKIHQEDKVTLLKSHGGNKVTPLNSLGRDTVTSFNSLGSNAVTSVNGQEGDPVASLKITPARPFMGCRSLSFAARKDQQICRNPNI